MKYLVCGLLFVAACSKEPAEAPKVIRPVRYHVVDGGAASLREFSGKVRSSMEANVSFKVDGTVTKVHVNVGDKVKKGGLLVELDASDYRIQVQEAQAALQQAKAQARNAKSSYERVRQMYEGQSASKSDLDRARASSESAEAAVNRANQQLALTQRRLGYTKLRAPEVCAVAAIDIEVNENVRAGQPVLQMTGQGDLEVEVAVPGVLIDRIKKNAPVSIRVDALGEAFVAGRVYEVGVSAVGNATTFPVTVRFSDAQPKVRSGMAAVVQFKFATSGSAQRIVVPSFAVRENLGSEPFVFIVEPVGKDLGRIKKQMVELGELSSGGLEVKGGLKGGERVVTAGVSRIQEGDEVRLLEQHRQ